MWKCVRLLALALAAAALAPGAAAQGAKFKYALGDVVSIDELPLLVAVERAKKRGVAVEVTPFKSEEIATQAVINGQADIGQGTPYAAVEKVNVPIRFFYQLTSLQFFPIVAKEHYKSWKDLDGQEIAVQSRGSGTEAIMNLMAKEHGIKYKNVSYVPGSNVRALALLKGTIRASILDASNKNFVMKEAPGRFIILPLGQVKASEAAPAAADVCVSAGNTGALMAVARYLLKTLEGIDRPAIATVMPNQHDGHTIVLDLGANVDCTAEHLLQFAIMGAMLVSAVERKERPSVGLLNIGAEDIKGNEAVKQAAGLLRAPDGGWGGGCHSSSTAWVTR